MDRTVSLCALFIPYHSCAHSRGNDVFPWVSPQVLVCVPLEGRSHVSLISGSSCQIPWLVYNRHLLNVCWTNKIQRWEWSCHVWISWANLTKIGKWQEIALDKAGKSAIIDFIERGTRETGGRATGSALKAGVPALPATQPSSPSGPERAS